MQTVDVHEVPGQPEWHRCWRRRSNMVHIRRATADARVVRLLRRTNGSRYVAVARIVRPLVADGPELRCSRYTGSDSILVIPVNEKTARIRRRKVCVSSVQYQRRREIDTEQL